MKQGTQVKIRLGCIDFINCLPFYFGLDDKTDSLEMHAAYPSKINLAMRQGKLDVAPISSLEYLNHQDKYLLLPDLGIASRDFSGSVLLFCKDRVEGLEGKRVALTRQSLSSATLLRILMKYRYKLQPKFVSMRSDLKVMLETCEGGLLIGDDALFHEPDRFLYKYDLSEMWWNWTEKPFCFAVWAVRREFAEQYPEEVARLALMLRQNRDHNLLDIEGLIRKTMGMTFLDKRFAKVYGYFFNLNFGLDESILEGLELYYRLAVRLGVSPRSKPIRFFK